MSRVWNIGLPWFSEALFLGNRDTGHYRNIFTGLSWDVDTLLGLHLDRDGNTLLGGHVSTHLLGQVLAVLVDVDNPALYVRDGLALLLVGCLEHGAAASVKGGSALRLHFGREGIFESCFTLNIINLAE